MKRIEVGTGEGSRWGDSIVIDPRFDAMIRSLEAAAARDPAAYRRRVALAGLLGYLVIGGLLALLVGLTIAMVALLVLAPQGAGAEAKFGIVFGGLSYALVRAIWITPPPPDGILLEREAAPALFAMIDRVRAATRGPKIAEVRITDQMNAAITQESGRLFLSGRNALYLGLPLLNGARVEEVEAIVAHEFGHIVGGHGHSAGFVYRIRQRWAQVADRLPDGIIAGLLRRFFRWYGPWFAAFSFTLARRQEYEADQVAARAVGASSLADALVRIAIQSDRFSESWRMIWSQSPLRPDPPRSPQTTLAAALAVEQETSARLAVDREQDRAADHHDTHPTLAQRLAALGQSASLPPPLDKVAAAHLLGGALESVVDDLDRQWHDAADEAWAADYAERQANIAERHALELAIAEGNPTRDDLYRHAWLIEATGTPQEAADAYGLVVDHHPDATDALYRQGDMLLEAGDESGAALLLEAGQREPALLAPAYGLIQSFFYRKGQTEEAARYTPLLDAAQQQADLASAEANGIDESARLRPLPADLRAHLADLSRDVPGCASLHAVLRDLNHSSKPQILFTFVARKGHVASQVLDALIEAMLPAGDLLGIEESVRRRWLVKRVRKMADSTVIPDR
jgi:Zn-dependent protease with chaperone function